MTEHPPTGPVPERPLAPVEIVARTATAIALETETGRLAQTLADALREATAGAIASVWLRREDADPAIFEPLALSGANWSEFPRLDEVDPRSLRFDGIFHPLFTHGQAQFVVDVATSERRHGFGSPHPPVGSYIAEPLFDRDRRVLGCLLVGDPKPGKFGPSDAEVDGLEVLRRLKSDPDRRRIPVVVMTSSQEETDLVRSYDLGANSYIVNPVDFEQFYQTVRALGYYWPVVNQPPPPSSSRLEPLR